MNRMDFSESDFPLSLSRVTLRNLLPANGLLGVFATISGDDGETKLNSVPLDFIGVATIHETVYESQEDYESDMAIIQDRDNAIVGIVVDGGEMNVVSLLENFAGYAKRNQDINDCVGCLSSKYRERLPKRK